MNTLLNTFLLLDFSSWWGDMSGLEKVYWCFALPISLIFLIQLVLTFAGGDFEGDSADVDADVDSDHGIGFQFFTFKNLIGFFTIFSWAGIACIKSGFGIGGTIAISAICGLVMMIIMASIFYFMSRLADSGTLQMNNAIGKIGEVYLPIQAKRGAFGKIQINVQGSMRELQALTDEEEDLKMGTVVQVVDVIDEHILLVKKSS